MTRWFNPRVVAVAVSIVVLVQVSKVGEPYQTIRIDLIACGLLYLLYIAAFLVPLWRSLGFRMVIGPGVMLTLGWISVAAALVADALPTPLAGQLQQRINWATVAFCIAGAVAFFIFFQRMNRYFEQREEMLEARGRERDS